MRRVGSVPVARILRPRLIGWTTWTGLRGDAVRTGRSGVRWWIMRGVVCFVLVFISLSPFLARY